jgi:AcrR family transcriptional regulator
MMTENENIRDAVINAAVALGARTSWEAVRLHDIAAELNISLDEIRGCFREKEDLVDAWFDRADGIMLREADTADFLALTSQQRIHRLIMVWLDALAVQRKVTLYLMTFFFWMRDESPGSRRTRQFLDRNLSLAMGLDQVIYGDNKPSATETPVDQISLPSNESAH